MSDSFAHKMLLPSLEKLKEGFNRIDDFSFINLEYKEIKDIFLSNLQVLPIFIKPDAEARFTTYRVRILKDGEDVSEEDTFSYPKKCDKNGRVHIAGHPVLYTSISPACAILEMKDLKEGQTIFLSKWEIKENIKPVYSELIFGDNANLGSNTNELNQANKKQLEKASKYYTEQSKEAFLYLVEKFSEYFLSDDYSRSSFIGHHLLYDIKSDVVHKPQALLYPSIAASRNDYNIAYHPEFVKNHMYLDKVYKLTFNRFVDNTASVFLNGIGLNDDKGKIHWLTPEVKKEQVKIKRAGIYIESENENNFKPAENKYYRNGKILTLRSFTEELLYEDMNKLKEVLIKEEIDIDFSKLHEKSILITFDEKEVAYAYNENRKIPISKVVVDIQYKLIGKYIEEENSFLEMELTG